MTDLLTDAMRDLAGAADQVPGPEIDRLYAGGRRRARRRWGLSALAGVAVVVLLGFLVWPPAPSSGPARPAGSGVTTPTYPSYVARPIRLPDLMQAHQPMTMAILGDTGLYAAAGTGAVWATEAPEASNSIALSADGRYVVVGRHIIDVVAGTSTPIAYRDRLGPVDADAVGAWWSPGSQRALVATGGGGSAHTGYVVDRTGSAIDLPTAAFGLDPLLVGWLDERTVLGLEVRTELGAPTATLQPMAWTVGAPHWTPVGWSVTWERPDVPPTAELSPDGQTLALVVSRMDLDGHSHDSAWLYDTTSGDPRPGSPLGEPLQPSPAGASHSEVRLDMATDQCSTPWRDGRPLISDGWGFRGIGSHTDLVSVSRHVVPFCTRVAGDALIGSPVYPTAARVREVLWYDLRAWYLLALLVVGFLRWRRVQSAVYWPGMFAFRLIVPGKH